jgi:hypothetical protein
MAPQVVAHPEARTKGEDPMATTESSASFANAHPSEDHDDTIEAHYASLERPHVCYQGVVYIGRVVEDPGTGEEVEVFEAVPCRKCVASEAQEA